MSKGVWAGLFAYAIWGFFPIYFHALSGVPAEQTTAHRVVWSFLFISIVILVRKEFGSFTQSLDWKKVGIYLLAGSLLAANWGTYVWAVSKGRVVEASLGYFINPVVSVLMGVVFLREKLRSLQWVVVGLAVFGVGLLTYSYGQVPWISLALAFTFGMYGFIKETGAPRHITWTCSGNDDDLCPGACSIIDCGIFRKRRIWPYIILDNNAIGFYRNCHSCAIIPFLLWRQEHPFIHPGFAAVCDAHPAIPAGCFHVQRRIHGLSFVWFYSHLGGADHFHCR